MSKMTLRGALKRLKEILDDDYFDEDGRGCATIRQVFNAGRMEKTFEAAATGKKLYTLEGLGYKLIKESMLDGGRLEYKRGVTSIHIKNGIAVKFDTTADGMSFEIMTFEEILACAERIEELLEEMEGEMPDEEQN